MSLEDRITNSLHTSQSQLQQASRERIAASHLYRTAISHYQQLPMNQRASYKETLDSLKHKYETATQNEKLKLDRHQQLVALIQERNERHVSPKKEQKSRHWICDMFSCKKRTYTEGRKRRSKRRSRSRKSRKHI